MGEYLEETSLSGRLPTGKGLARIPLESWAWIAAEIKSRFSDRHAALLAEPETEDAECYSWFAAASGPIKKAVDLPQQEREALESVARQRIEDIRRHAVESLQVSSQNDKALLGAVISEAVLGLEQAIPDSLYSVGGEPVFVDWGIKRATIREAPKAPEVKRTERDKPQKHKAQIAVSLNYLWLLFLVLCGLIFWRLVDGCAMFRLIGGAPNFCRAEATLSPELKTLIIEREALSKDISILNRHLTSTPVCGYEAPAFPARGEGETVENPLAPPIVTPAAPDPATATAIELNDLLRDAGGAACEGVEVIATWAGEADIDLHLYCPVPDTAPEDIDDSRMVGPGNDAACGAYYDVSSAGSQVQTNIERICLTEEAELGEYVASIYQDIDAGATAPALVTITLRSANNSDTLAVTSKPGEEADDYMPILIE